ncbi:hypothetical protein AWJ20_5121 [Sugiyamaella lignohabitans]|uniref:Conserved oligomeric Golgi complex subunit 1 n=1 Tax=Sugiyamaella lignohabitans TaxID=796027 RepID=A0A167EJV0_9ASCO|nr:uncharacterized protein AWJ20_5121 [Sugiyamaella lignohabitans]ANB14162.1 hypothetical protein AWJ20_5121 [Sugiyamaella lignohabitans]
MSAIDTSQTWENIFSTQRVSEIQHLSRQLRADAEAKKQSLRDLVGGRYRDLLQTADTIMAMNELVSVENTTLSQLYDINHYSRWNKDDVNVVRFLGPLDASDRRDRLVKTSSRRLYNGLIQLIKRQLRGFRGDSTRNILLISRSIFLARLVSQELCGLGEECSTDNVNSQELKILSTKCLEMIENELLGTAGGVSFPANIEPRSGTVSPDLFVAFMIASELPPDELLKGFLESREELVSQLLDENDSSCLFKSLFLISSTLSVSNHIFAQNQLHRLAAQQASVYTILDSPEFEDEATRISEELGFEKVRSWLPKSIRESPCLPKKCIAGIQGNGRANDESRQAFKKIQTKFIFDVVDILSTKLGDIMARITDLGVLVKIYSEILELLLRDSSIFLSEWIDCTGGKGESIVDWFNGKFQKEWASRFVAILSEQVVGSGKSVKQTAHNTYNSILGNQLQSEFSSDNSKDDLLISSITGLPLEERLLNDIFKHLNDFSKGYYGDIGLFSRDCVEWSETFDKLGVQVDEFSRLKVHFSSSSLAIYDHDEISSAWRSQGEDNIIQCVSKFKSIILSDTVKAYNSIVDYLEQLSSSEKTNCRSLSFVIKCISVLYETIGVKACETKGEGQQTQHDVEPILIKTYERLSKELVDMLLIRDNLGYGRLDEAFDVWEDADGVLIPKSPSTMLLSSLSRIAISVGETVGNDGIVWKHEIGSGLIRKAVYEALANEVERIELTYKDALKIEPSGSGSGSGGVEEKAESESIDDNNRKDREDVGVHKENTDEKHEVESHSQDSVVKSSDELKETINGSGSSSSATITSAQALVQLYADHTFIELLFGTSHRSSIQSPELPLSGVSAADIDSAMKDMVSRTALMFSPLI